MFVNKEIIVNEINSLNKAFFELSDQVFKLSDSEDLKKIYVLTNELQRYIEKHIKLEEDFMEKINMPNMQSHIIQHKFFVQKINEIKHELEYKNTFVLNNLSTFLKKWHILHINTSERQYKEILYKDR